MGADRVHRVVEPAQLGREHLDGPGVLAVQCPHERRQEPELGHEPGAHEEVGVGSLHPGVGVGLEHGLDGLGGRVGDERREVVGRVGDLGVLPPRHRPDPPRRGVGFVGEHREHLVPGEVAVGRGGGEAPEGDVLEGRLPAGEEGGRDAPALGRAVELREAPGAVRVGVVGRQARLLEHRGVGVVQHGQCPAQLGRHPRPRWQLGEVEVVPGEVGVDGGAPALGQGDEAPGGGHGEGQPAPEQREEGDRAVHLGAGHLGARGADDPPSVLGVLHEGDVEGLLRRAGERLDAHRVEPRDGRAGQRGEEGGAAVHEPTVCRGPPIGWKACPEPTECHEPTRPSPTSP